MCPAAVSALFRSFSSWRQPSWFRFPSEAPGMEAPRTDGGSCHALAGRGATKKGPCTTADGGVQCVSRSPCRQQLTPACHPVNKAGCHSQGWVSQPRAKPAAPFPGPEEHARLPRAWHRSRSERQGIRPWLLLPPRALQIRSGACSHVLLSRGCATVPQLSCGRD